LPPNVLLQTRYYSCSDDSVLGEGSERVRDGHIYQLRESISASLSCEQQHCSIGTTPSEELPVRVEVSLEKGLVGMHPDKVINVLAT
jgi:hypothetical protein